MFKKYVPLLALALAAAPLAPALGNPGSSSSSDWAVNCTGEGAERVCDAVQALVDQKDKTERVRLAFARQKTTGKYAVVAKVPLGFRLDSGLMLRLNDSNNKPIEGLTFSRCTPEGCYAEKPLAEADLGKLRTATALQIVFLQLDGKPVIIPMSTKGLKAALDSL